MNIENLERANEIAKELESLEEGLKHWVGWFRTNHNMTLTYKNADGYTMDINLEKYQRHVFTEFRDNNMGFLKDRIEGLKKEFSEL